MPPALKLFRVLYDSLYYYVEAKNFNEALKLWAAYITMIDELREEESADLMPDSIEYLDSDYPVIHTWTKQELEQSRKSTDKKIKVLGWESK